MGSGDPAELRVICKRFRRMGFLKACGGEYAVFAIPKFVLHFRRARLKIPRIINVPGRVLRYSFSFLEGVRAQDDSSRRKQDRTSGYYLGSVAATTPPTGSKLCPPIRHHYFNCHDSSHGEQVLLGEVCTYSKGRT